MQLVKAVNTKVNKLKIVQRMHTLYSLYLIIYMENIKETKPKNFWEERNSGPKAHCMLSCDIKTSRSVEMGRWHTLHPLWRITCTLRCVNKTVKSLIEREAKISEVIWGLRRWEREQQWAAALDKRLSYSSLWKDSEPDSYSMTSGNPQLTLHQTSKTKSKECFQGLK